MFTLARASAERDDRFAQQRGFDASPAINELVEALANTSHGQIAGKS